MKGGKPPIGRAVTVLRAAEKAGVRDLAAALALDADGWRQFGAGRAILKAIDRSR